MVTSSDREQHSFPHTRFDFWDKKKGMAKRGRPPKARTRIQRAIDNKDRKELIWGIFQAALPTLEKGEIQPWVPQLLHVLGKLEDAPKQEETPPTVHVLDRWLA